MQQKHPDNEKVRARVRLNFSLAVTLLSLLCVCVVAKALYTMTLKRDFWLEVRDNNKQVDLVLKPQRGNILAVGGEVLAASIPEFVMYMDFMTWEKEDKRALNDQLRRDTLLFGSYARELWRGRPRPTKYDSAKMARLTENRLDTICQGMHRIFPDIDPVKFRAYLKKGRHKQSHSWPLYTAEVLYDSVQHRRRRKRENARVTYIQYAAVKELPVFRNSAGYGGFRVDTIQVRKNPYGSLARRVVGKFEDTARYGIERTFDTLLAGKPGKYHIVKVMGDRIKEVDYPAQDGYDVQTTIDVNFQDICEKALKDKLVELQADEGVCLLMEVATGDIKAMTSFDRNPDGSYSDNRPAAVSNLYEPGSVFKPMSFLVALDDGKISMTDRVDVGNGIYTMHKRQMRDHNWRNGVGYGVLTVPEVLMFSSNIGVSLLIDRKYGQNPEQFIRGLDRIGVTEDLRLPLDHYHKPYIRRPESKYWSKTSLPWLSIGYESQLPPVSTLSFYNGVANNGKMMKPRLVKALLKDGEVVREYPVSVLREQMAKPEAVKNIQECLYRVVHGGLGKKAGSPRFPVSGKTGTAQVWTSAGKSQLYLVSFAGYFPSNAPKYSCIVCIKKCYPASGGGHCGPVFKRVAETIMAQEYKADFKEARDTVHSILPVVNRGNVAAGRQVLEELGVRFDASFSSDQESVVWGVAAPANNLVSLSAEGAEPGTVPDVRNYGLRDALFRLERLGLRVKVQGVGRVSRQSLAPGYVFKAGETIELQLTDKRLKKDEWKEDSLLLQQPKPSSPKSSPSPSDSTGQPAAATANAPKAPMKPSKKAKQTALLAVMPKREKV